MKLPNATFRNGLTLVEVLATIFILAIGMVSVLVLFPVGALKVRQALINERIALTASQAESVFKILFGSNKSAIQWPSSGSGPEPNFIPLADGSKVAVIDPLAPGNTIAGNIITESFEYKGNNTVGVMASGPTPNYRNWFTLTDDIEFSPNGSPESSAIARGTSFAFSLMVRKTTISGKDTYELTTLAYHGRNINLPNQTNEVDLALDLNPPNGADFNIVGATAIEITGRPTEPTEGRTLEKGSWIIDYTQVDGNQTKQQLEFYQVQNIIDLGANRFRLELDRPIINRFSTANVYRIQNAKWIDRLVGVFYKGEINLP